MRVCAKATPMSHKHPQRKGLSHIRTTGNTRGRSAHAYQVHMRLVSLELERHRHATEYERLQDHLRLTKARLERLDTEARELRALLDAASNPDVEVKAVTIVNNETVDGAAKPKPKTTKKTHRY